MTAPLQGEVWWAESEDTRRPVLIVTRSIAATMLNRLTVAPITTRVRNIPTEISLGRGQGLRRDSVASFDNLLLLPLSVFIQRIGTLDLANEAICRALEALADC